MGRKLNKTKSISESIDMLEDGMTIGVGGWGPRRKPMALIREILRSDLKNLSVVSYGGADVGMLCASGKIKKLIFAFVSLDFIPLEPYFRRARENGEIEILEIDEGMMLLGLRAAAMGAPFIPTAIGLGTDVVTRNAEIQTIVSPYNDGREWVAMPAIKLDVALVHVDRADKRGVCQIRGPDHYMDDLFVRAASRSIVSCDEIVDTECFHVDPLESRFVFWERSATTTVVHARCGAHPSSCNPLYGIDVDHLKLYAAGAKESDGWKKYYDDFVADGEESYLNRVGGDALVRALPLQVY